MFRQTSQLHKYSEDFYYFYDYNHDHIVHIMHKTNTDPTKTLKRKLTFQEPINSNEYQKILIITMYYIEKVRLEHPVKEISNNVFLWCLNIHNVENV